MARLTNIILGAVVFTGMLQTAQAGPFIAVAILATVIGSSVVGVACSVGHCKRSTAETITDYITGISECTTAISAATVKPNVVQNSSIITIDGLPASCIAAHDLWVAASQNTTLQTAFGVTNVLNETAIEVSLPWIMRRMLKM